MARLSRRTSTATILTVIILAASGAGLRWWSHGRFLVGTDDAYVRADMVVIAPQVAGSIAEVAVADNQQVEAGQILARLDDRDYRARVEQAEGALAAARAEVAARDSDIANLDAQLNQQGSLIAGARADLDVTAAEVRRTDLDLRRQSALYEFRDVSAQAFETAEAGAKQAIARRASARAALAVQQQRVPVLVTGRRTAVAELEKERAALRQAEATLTLARLDLERTFLRAPVAGTVGQRSLRVGQYAEVGVPLMAVVPGEAYVVANYKETQIDRVHPGQPVEIEVDAFGGRVMSGHVDSFSPASGAQFALLPPDNATGNFTKIVQRLPVRIRIDAGQDRAADLRPGMSVVTSIDTHGPAR
jgi:membrane fusion protein (multidrug efflux system)